MAEGTATVSSATGKETKTEIEIIEYVNGYFYVEDTGAYAGKRGNCEDCYVLNKGVNITNDLENAEYIATKIKKLEITHEQFKQICGVIYCEDNDSFEIMAALTQASYNAVNNSKPNLTLKDKSKYVAHLLFSTDYSSVKNKKQLDDNNSTLKNNLMRKALIHVLLSKRDYSIGAIRWDGVDFLVKGKNHVKAKSDGGISITKTLWFQLVNNWLPNTSSSISYASVKYKRYDCINNIPFIISEIPIADKKIQMEQIQNECKNVWKVTENLFETEGTGKYNKGNILNKATVVIGKTIFWGTNKMEPKNKDYSWKSLLNSQWFVL